MAITRVRNVIIVPTADSGIALPVGFLGEVRAVVIKAAAASCSVKVYSGQAVDAAKIIADIGDVAANSFDGIAGIDAGFENGIYVAVTGVGAVAYVYLRP